jgi:hypothetical protein
MGLSHSPSIVTNGLVLCLDAANPKSYPGSGTAWTDLSGIGNNGTLQNSPTYNTSNLGNFSLDGVDDRVLISCNTSTIRTFNSTTQFIIKLPTYSGGQRCILSYRGGGGGNLYIGKQSNGIFCYYDSLSPSPAYTVGTIADNAIAHVAVTCDATNNLLSIYINGILIGSASRTGWLSAFHTSLYLGWDAGTGEFMLGNFYQFSHYNRVLTATEILQNFNALRGRYGI